MRAMDTGRIAALIGDVRAGINDFLVRELKRRGIEDLAPSHGAIMAHLFANREVRMKDLAKAVRRDKSTITALVDKLVRGGYVRRENGLEDQRTVYVRLTRKGEDLEIVFREISDELLRRAWRGIDRTEQEEVMRLLQRIEANFE